jgi:hypothetical protein
MTRRTGRDGRTTNTTNIGKRPKQSRKPRAPKQAKPLFDIPAAEHKTTVTLPRDNTERAAMTLVSAFDLVTAERIGWALVEYADKQRALATAT